MTLYKNKYHVESTRLKNWDYSSPGFYFITIVTLNRDHLFGRIKNGEMVLNDYGAIANLCWDDIPNHFHFAKLDYFIIMPNHVHGIIEITNQNIDNRAVVVKTRHAQNGLVETRHAVSLPNKYQTEKFGKPTKNSIPTIIRSYKSAVTKQINEIRSTPGKSIWQPKYYDHIIRNEMELFRIRNYIRNNPANWKMDRNN